MKRMAQIISWDGEIALTLLNENKAERVKEMMADGKAFVEVGELGLLIIASIKSFEYILMPDDEPDVLNLRGDRAERLLNRHKRWNNPEEAAKLLESHANPYGNRLD